MVVGVVLLVVGLAVLGWFGYQYIGTSIVARQGYEQQAGELEQQWGAGTAGTADTADRMPGVAVAIMRVPAFGADWQVPILDGTDEAVLARGLGWYENTAGPGKVGNFAVAGHVVTHGQPFNKLPSLPAGSIVEVETREATYSYVIDSSTEVKDTETWVLDPVPGEAGREPTEELITLTTCADVFRSPDRHIAFGHLVSVATK